MAENEAYINAKVPEELKEQCKSHVENDPDTNNLSHLVRKSLQAVTGGDADGRREVVQESDIDQKDVAEIKQGLRTLRSQLDNLGDDISEIKRQTSEATEIKRLASTVFEVLPTKEELEKWERGHVPPSRRGDEHDTAYAGSVTAISNVIGKDELAVRNALEQLEADTHLIHTTERDGETCYYKEE